MSDYFLSNEQLLEVLNLTKTATAIHVTEDAIIQMANDSMLNIWAKDRSVIGKSLEDALPELKGQPFIDMFKKVWREGLTISGKDTPAGINVNGKVETFYFDFEYKAIKDTSGQTICILHTAIDVTERLLKEQALEQAQKREVALEREQALNEELAASNEELNATNEELQIAQESLRNLNNELETRITERTKKLSDSEARLRSIFKQSSLAFSVYNGPDHIIELANDNILKIWGKSTEVIGTPYATLNINTDDNYFLKLLDQVYTTGEPFAANEVKAYNAENEEHWGYFNFIYQPMKDEHGTINGILAIKNDVTERVLSRQNTDRINDQLALAVDAANIGIWNIHPETKALQYNSMLAKLFGYEGTDAMTYDQAIGQVTEQYREILVKEIENAIENGGNYDFTYTQRRFNDGEIIWLRSIGKISKDAQNKYTLFSGVVMDISEQIASALNLQNINEELAASVEELANTNEELAAANEEYSAINEEMLATNEELGEAQKNLHELVNKLKISEADYKQAIESGRMGIWDFNFATQEFTISDRCREMFGFNLTEEVSFDTILAAVDPAYQQMLKNTLHNIEYKNQYNDIEFPITHLLTNDQKWIRVIGKTHTDSAGNSVNFTGMNMDITEQKQDEQRKNDFIGMVSHELKTPLTSLSGYVQLLQAKAQKADDAFTSRALDTVNKQVTKMAGIINGFLNISRLESGKILLDKSSFSLKELIESNIDETRLIGSGHIISYNPGDQITVFADYDKISNVVSNILSNAVKYAPNNGTIEVNSGIVDGKVQVSVKDYGMGIEKQDLERLFERYYRVENNHTISGFGIGLYLSAEIIDRHKGKIWVESELGKGSTFYFSLPLN